MSTSEPLSDGGPYPMTPPGSRSNGDDTYGWGPTAWTPLDTEDEADVEIPKQGTPTDAGFAAAAGSDAGASGGLAAEFTASEEDFFGWGPSAWELTDVSAPAPVAVPVHADPTAPATEAGALAPGPGADASTAPLPDQSYADPSPPAGPGEPAGPPQPAMSTDQALIDSVMGAALDPTDTAPTDTAPTDASPADTGPAMESAGRDPAVTAPAPRPSPPEPGAGPGLAAPVRLVPDPAAPPGPKGTGGSPDRAGRGASKGVEPTGTDCATVVQSAITGSVAVLLVNDDADRYAEEPEALRLALASVRRLRSDLRIFRRFLDYEWVAPLRNELAWYAGLVGAVRDVDLLAARLLERTAERSGSGDDATVGLLDALGEWRAAALDALDQGMQGDRHAELVGTLTEAARTLPWHARAAEPADKALPPLLSRPWRDLREAARAASVNGSDGNLWALRSRARRLRDAAEATAPVLGPRVAKLGRAADALAATSDVVHQAAAMRDWLDAVVDTAPELGYSAGKLWVEEGLAADAARAAWPAEFRQVRKRWRRWRRGG